MARLRSHRVTAIVLAGGASSRFGSPKQLARLGRITLLARTLRVVKASNVAEVVLVLGHRADEIAKHIPGDVSKIVVNRDYKSGLASSLRTGLGAASPGTDFVLVVLADQPFLAASTINGILTAQERTGKKIVAPVAKGRQGNPVLFHRSLFKELETLAGDTGARSVIEGHPGDVLWFEVGDPKYLEDIDTVEDLRQASLSGRSSGQGRPRSRAAGAPRPGRHRRGGRRLQAQRHNRSSRRER